MNNNNNIDIGDILKQIISMTRVLKDFSRGCISPKEDQQIVEDFFNNNDNNYQKALSLYWQAMSLIALGPQNSMHKEDNTTDNITDEQVAGTYVIEMNQLLRLLYAQRYESIIENYIPQCEHMFSDIGNKAKEIFLSNNITNLPPSKRIFIDRMMQTWVVTDESMISLKDYIDFQNRINMTAVPLDKDVENKYFLNFIEYFTSKLYSPLSTTKNTIDMHTKYWFDQVINRLKSNDINTIFEDDLINLLIQIADKGVFRAYKTTPIDESKLNNQRKETLSLPCFSEDKIEANLKTMDDIIDKYRSIPIDDKNAIKEYVNAYKTVFLKEFLSKNQEGAKHYSSDYSKFILTHMDSFADCGLFTPTDGITLFKRAACDYTIKDAKRQFVKEYGNSTLDNVIFYANPDCYYNNCKGTANYMNGLSIVCLTDLLNRWCKDSLSIVSLITHEVNHCSLQTYNFGNANLGFEAYMTYKTDLANEYRDYITNNNYEDLYYELRANLAENEAQIATLESFPVGYDSYKKGEKQRFLKISIMDIYRESLYNKLNDGTQKRFAVNIFDEVLKENSKDIGLDVPARISKRSKLAEILLFDYHKDGTPKSLQEILEDQEKELDTGVFVPSVGPQNKFERLKFRLNVMMYRAVAYNKQEEFVEITNNFLQKHHDELYQDDFFKEVCPDGILPSGDKAIEIYRRLAQDTGNRNVELVFDLSDVIYRAEDMRRKRFGKEVITLAQNHAIPQKSIKNPKESHSQLNTLDEQEDQSQ